jgi:hypothetical protein
VKMRFPESVFSDALIQKNRLRACDFDRFVFFAGMLFGSDKKWWGKPGLRNSSHEGLDLCFFESTGRQYFRLDESVRVPMLYDGRVEHITDDFLGKTVIASHCFDGSGQPAILSLYGHLNPDKNIRIGDEITQGQVFAKIAGLKNQKQILLPHLHISLAKPGMLPPPDRLEWEFLNTVDRCVFIDPMEAIAPEYRVMEYDDTPDLAEKFIRCSQR